MTWEQAQAHIEALNQQVAQLIQQNQGHTDLIQQLVARATAADESHSNLISAFTPRSLNQLWRPSAQLAVLTNAAYSASALLSAIAPCVALQVRRQ